MKEEKLQASIEKISNLFKDFAERECKNTSKLYYQLSKKIAEDQQLLRLAANCSFRQPVPNLFLAAIHYLLLKSEGERLADYYPSISKKKVDSIPIELVKEFCKRKEKEIIEILQTRIVQTNAINRTAYLMPILSSLFRRQGFVNLVDIGTSSGLAMNFGMYEYQYGANKRFGSSNVKIATEVINGSIPPFEKIVRTGKKIGIDQNPLDLSVSDNGLWLKSLIWTDLSKRFNRLEQAIELAIASNIELVKASSINQFKQVIEQVPKDEPLVVYHTHVLYQFTKGERIEFRAMLDGIGEHKDFVYLAVEGNAVFDKDYNRKGILIELSSYIDGEKKTRIIGQTDGHATWVKWD